MSDENKCWDGASGVTRVRCDGNNPSCTYKNSVGLSDYVIVSYGSGVPGFSLSGQEIPHDLKSVKIHCEGTREIVKDPEGDHFGVPVCKCLAGGQGGHGTRLHTNLKRLLKNYPAEEVDAFLASRPLKS